MSRARHNESTSNLVRHVDRCEPANTPESRAIIAFAQGSTYNPATHRMKIALWVTRRHRPFSIVEDPELLDIFHDLNNKVVTPSASTVSRDVKEIFLISRHTVRQVLQAYPGKLHLIVDGWTSPQVISFLGTCIAMISAGKLVVIILDFIKYVEVVSIPLVSLIL